jgi:hypothetical protein
MTTDTNNNVQTFQVGFYPEFADFCRQMTKNNIEIRKRTEAAEANMPPIPDYIWGDDWYIANPEQAPFPWMTDRMTLVIDNTVPPNSTESSPAMELIRLIFTDKGAVFEIDEEVCSGWLKDNKGVKHTFYGSRAALEAIGATNIE